MCECKYLSPWIGNCNAVASKQITVPKIATLVLALVPINIQDGL